MALLAEPGRHPDIEALVMDLAAQVEVDGEPIGPQATGTLIPDHVGARFIHVERTLGSGGLDRYGITDTALIYIGTRAETRAVSRQMIQQLRERLRALADSHVYKGVLIDRCVESSAPGPIAGSDPDERLVETGYVFACRAHHGDPVPA